MKAVGHFFTSIVSIFLLFTSSVDQSTSSASAHDVFADEHNDEAVCAHAKPYHGLCHAFCVSQACVGQEVLSKSCEKLKDNYVKLT